MIHSTTPEDAPACEADAQAIHVVGVLHAQADCMMDQAAHTTLEADAARAEAVRLDAQADQFHVRAARLHERANELRDEVADTARAASEQTQADI